MWALFQTAIDLLQWFAGHAFIVGAVVLYLATMAARTPFKWPVVAPVIGLLAYMGAGSVKLQEGIDIGETRERVKWQIEVQKAREARRVSEVDAARRIAEIERAALSAQEAAEVDERERALELHRVLERASRTPQINTQPKGGGNEPAKPCRCLDRIVPDSILRSIR